MRKAYSVLFSAIALAAIALTSCRKAAFSDNKNISVVVREDGSGTKSAFMEIIGLKGKADPAGVIVATGTAAVLAEVKTNPHALAYDSLGYVTADVKKLTVDNVEATIANIKSGDYKIARPLSIVYKAATLTDTVNNAFFTFLQSADAQTIITNNGYVSIIDGATNYQVQSSLTGTIDISGSTSLQPLMVLLAAKFEQLQTKVEVTVAGGGSGTGYQNAENGVSDFGMISEEFKVTKAPSCIYHTVAKDGIAVIANQGNTHTNISLADLKNIYNLEENAATKIKTWGQVN